MLNLLSGCVGTTHHILGKQCKGCIQEDIYCGIKVSIQGHDLISGYNLEPSYNMKEISFYTHQTIKDNLASIEDEKCDKPSLVDGVEIKVSSVKFLEDRGPFSIKPGVNVCIRVSVGTTDNTQVKNFCSGYIDAGVYVWSPLMTGRRIDQESEHFYLAAFKKSLNVNLKNAIDFLLSK